MKQMRHIRTGIHSVLMFHVGASDIKLAPTIFAKVRARSRRCSSFPNRTRCAGLRCGFGCKLGSCWHLYCCDIPRRSKVRFAPTSFYVWGKKDIICPLPCSSFPNRNRCAGLRFGIAASLRFYCVHENMDFSRSLPARNPFAFCGLRGFYVILSSS